MIGDLSERSILTVLQEVHFRRLTGILEVDGGEQKRRLFLRDGSLYLAGSHPLARRLGDLVKSLLDQSPSAVAAESRARGLDLVSRMAQVIAEWRQGKFRFVEDPTVLVADLVGPLPTRRLLMVGATIGATLDELTSRLGGEQIHLVAVPAGDEPEDPEDLLGLGPEEHFLLERLRQPMTLGSIVAESPLDREGTVQRLAQLLAARQIRVLERADPRERSGAALDATLIQRLSSRFERDLRDEPLELSAEEFRTGVAELLAKVGAMNFYELLDVDTSSSVDLVQSKYEKLARRVHPANEKAYGLTGMKPMLTLLFERATQGYLVLSDPERRRRYNESQAIDLASSKVTGAQRDEEAKELARQHFDQAQVLVARGDFHFAVELLQLAAGLDRRAEYLLALARVQSKNPKWLTRAVDSCRAALELEPHNAEVRFQLGEIYEQLGQSERARAQFTAAAREDPGHVQANAKMRSYGTKTPRQEEDSGLFSRIFRRRDG
jgi:tetratricopeptide (TPR) repeat protein